MMNANMKMKMMITQVGSTLEETEQLLAEHNSFKEKARETREKVNNNTFYTFLSALIVFYLFWKDVK